MRPASARPRKPFLRDGGYHPEDQMTDNRRAVEEELTGVTAKFREKRAALEARTAGPGEDGGGWTRQHAAALFEELDAALHGLKERLSISDHPAHGELEVKVDEARADLEAELGQVEDGDHGRTLSIVEAFHRRVDQWMEDLQAEGKEW
jgi:hypothetical protein